MDHLVCNVCDHRWIARVAKPQKCPKCQHRDWQGRDNRPRPEREE